MEKMLLTMSKTETRRPGIRYESSKVEREAEPSRVERVAKPSRLEREAIPSRLEPDEKPSRFEREAKPSRVEREEKSSPLEREAKPSRLDREPKPNRLDRQEKPNVVERVAKRIAVEQEAKISRPKLEAEPISTKTDSGTESVVTSPKKAVKSPKDKIEKVKTFRLKIVAALPTEIKSVPAVEPNADGLYELNTVQAEALEQELDRLMDVVTKEFAADPTTEADELFIQNFNKKPAEDMLRNALGLNVTKRILNIHNPLNIIVECDKDIERDVKSFESLMKSLNCAAVKRLPGLTYRETKKYMVQANMISHMDRICSKPKLRLKKLAVNIKPHCKFFKCPPNIKTNYKVERPVIKVNKKNTDTESTDEVTSEINNETKAKEKTAVDENVETSAEIIVEKQEILDAKSNITNKQTIDIETTQIKADENVNKDVNKTNDKQAEAKKATLPNTTPLNRRDDKEVVAKKPTSLSSRRLSGVTTTPNKSQVKKTNAKVEEAKKTTTLNKSQVNQQSDAEAETKKPTTPNKSQVNPSKDKEEEKKPTTPNQTQNNKEPEAKKPTTPNKSQVKKPNDKEEEKKPTTPKKSQVIQLNDKEKDAKKSMTLNKIQVATNQNVAVKSSDQSKIVEVKKKIEEIFKKPLSRAPPSKKPSLNQQKAAKNAEPGDFDELDDEDILAIMSDAIVVDECSGSDEDT